MAWRSRELAQGAFSGVGFKVCIDMREKRGGIVIVIPLVSNHVKETASKRVAAAEAQFVKRIVSFARYISRPSCRYMFDR